MYYYGRWQHCKSRCHNYNFRAIYVSSTALKEVTKRGALSVVLRSTVVRMGEMEVDQRLRDLQREYLDFLDDEVLKLLYYYLYVKTSGHLNTVTSTRKL